MRLLLFKKHSGFISVHSIICLSFKGFRLKIKKNKASKGKTLLIIHGLHKLDTKDDFKNTRALKSIPSQKIFKNLQWIKSIVLPCHTDEGIVCFIFMTNTSLVYIHLSWLFHSAQGTLGLELYKNSNHTWCFPNIMLCVA